MRKYRSVNMTKQKVPQAKFEEYYERLKETSKSKLFNKPTPCIFDATNIMQAGKKYAFNKCDSQPN